MVDNTGNCWGVAPDFTTDRSLLSAAGSLTSLLNNASLVFDAGLPTLPMSVLPEATGTDFLVSQRGPRFREYYANRSLHTTRSHTQYKTIFSIQHSLKINLYT